MIDVHCHLEQRDYDADRDEVIEKCKKELKAVITSCVHPRDFDLTLQMIEKHKNFVFATVGIHPQYVKEISEKEKEEFFELIRKNKEKFVGIGETGLDYNWVREENWRKKQRDWFVDSIALAKELKLPLVIHSWDANGQAIEILEKEDMKEVLMHMFESNNLTHKVVKNGWFISTNAIVLKSKKRKKVVRDTPIEQLLLETDAPWLAPEGFGSKRNDPTAIKFVAEKIAEIKKIPFEEVWEKCGENAIEFFDLARKSFYM